MPMAQKSHPSKAQMNTHLLLEAIIAATSIEFHGAQAAANKILGYEAC
jgi:hypothetical protein